jgi:hypothetical protein
MSFSKDPNQVLQDALNKGYSRVRFQQGKPVLDRELNLLGDLANPQRLAASYIGDGVPTGSDGFAITSLDVAANDFTIGAGRCLVNGSEVVLSSNTKYKSQPHKEKVAAFPPGASGVYLRVFPTQTTEVQDPNLNNQGDVGSVTSLREKADWEVIVSVAPLNSDHYLLANINTAANKITDMRRKGLTVETLRDDVTADRDAIKKIGDRLDLSHTANGDLKPNVVGATQIVNASVDNTKLAPNAVLEANIANNAISKRTIQDRQVSMMKLGLTQVVVDQQVVVPAATGGVPGENVVTLLIGDEFAFFLISVRQILPRPQLPNPIGFIVNWMQRTLVVKGPGLANPYAHMHQVVFQNPTATPQTVACRAFRIADT